MEMSILATVSLASVNVVVPTAVPAPVLPVSVVAVDHALVVPSAPALDMADLRRR